MIQNKRLESLDFLFNLKIVISVEWNMIKKNTLLNEEVINEK